VPPRLSLDALIRLGDRNGAAHRPEQVGWLPPLFTCSHESTAAVSFSMKNGWWKVMGRAVAAAPAVPEPRRSVASKEGEQRW